MTGWRAGAGGLCGGGAPAVSTIFSKASARVRFGNNTTVTLKFDQLWKQKSKKARSYSRKAGADDKYTPRSRAQRRRHLQVGKLPQELCLSCSK